MFLNKKNEFGGLTLEHLLQSYGNQQCDTGMGTDI